MRGGPCPGEPRSLLNKSVREYHHDPVGCLIAVQQHQEQEPTPIWAAHWHVLSSGWTCLQVYTHILWQRYRSAARRFTPAPFQW
jgi:hypothetical protein